MKILIVYGTLSGSTMTAAGVIAQTLSEKGHTAQELPVDQATKESLTDYDMVIFGSPSWEDKGQDGQPLPEMTRFLETLSKEDLVNKKVTLFGLGDTMYPHFCGAVDVMTEKLKQLDVSLALEPIRIDRYYSIPENEQKLIRWTQNLVTDKS